MKNRRMLIILVNIFAFLFSAVVVSPQDIQLPGPSKTGGKPLMEALSERQTARSFSPEMLGLQQLSDLLWAGWGINRPEGKKRTAPSARNVQELDIYVCLANGLYIYDAENNLLKQVHNRDIRKLTGTQEYVAAAPVNLIFVADMAKLKKSEGDEITDSDLLYPWANTGFIAENIYLFCASSGLGCVVRGSIPREELSKEMNLRTNQVIILAQSIGKSGN